MLKAARRLLRTKGDPGCASPAEGVGRNTKLPPSIPGAGQVCRKRLSLSEPVGFHLFIYLDMQFMSSSLQ